MLLLKLLLDMLVHNSVLLHRFQKKSYSTCCFLYHLFLLQQIFSRDIESVNELVMWKTKQPQSICNIL